MKPRHALLRCARRGCRGQLVSANGPHRGSSLAAAFQSYMLAVCLSTKLSVCLSHMWPFASLHRRCFSAPQREPPRLQYCVIGEVWKRDPPPTVPPAPPSFTELTREPMCRITPVLQFDSENLVNKRLW